jgi:predicted metal-dependent HD superfamily phosphohydrolase
MSINASVLAEAEAWAGHFLAENIKKEFVFHNTDHTAQVVSSARTIAGAYDLPEKELSLVSLAALFHDLGYNEGPYDHESRSCDIATSYLKDKITEQDLEIITDCIKATRMPQSADTLLEQILCDADLSHLGLKSYWEMNSRLRQEFTLSRNLVMSDLEWVDFELKFLSEHEYYTPIAQEMFNDRKAKHLQQLLKQKQRIKPDSPPKMHELDLTAAKDRTGDLTKALRSSEKDLMQARLGRGVETMYRTTYNTNNNLSTMADSKANMMLSINTIVISIVVSSLLPRLDATPKLIIPTALLLLTCLLSIVFATLSTRPKITEGKVDRVAIENRTANLLFFGNFYKMSLPDYQWGINEMLKDPEFLYNTMTRDLYFLGIVLAKKYNYLSHCYNIFMWGLIISLAAFGITFLI